jgi:hypothetical protein
MTRCLLLSLVAVAAISGCRAAEIDATVARQKGRPQVYVRVNFDSGPESFKAVGPGRVALNSDPSLVISGRSLQIERTAPGRYFGALMPVNISGSADLRIAFLTRARSMENVAVNVFDRLRQDNTTPSSPVRIADEAWRPVVFAVEDFHYNADPPDEKIRPDTRFESLLFHGSEAGPSPAIWIEKLAIYRGPDRVPPEAPSNVRVSAESDGSIALQWQEAADDTFAVVYSIYRREGAQRPWQKIAESLQPMYRDRPSSQGAVDYRITAADYDNNVSAPSTEVTATPAGVAAASTDPARANAPAQVTDRLNYAANIREVQARGAGKVRHDVFLFAGDSITVATLYTHSLGSWLARGLPVRQGVGTVTAAYGAANIGKYLTDARPEFAVVMYGTNDVARGEPTAASMRELAAIVDACVQVGTIPVLATIPPRGFNPRNQGDQERYNRGVAQLGRQKRVPVSYVFEEMLQHDLKTILDDGIHLTPQRGNDVAGRALRKTMDQVYFALRETSDKW